MSTQVSPRNPANHFFTVPTKAKENSAEVMFKKMYESNFVRPNFQNNLCKFNILHNLLYGNIRRCLELLENETHMIYQHYQLQLPWKEKKVILPDNRVGFKFEFERDRNFLDRYKSFVAELLVKRHAKKYASGLYQGKTFYAPNHGVYNVNKGNICVAFSCGSQYKDFCINYYLSFGPGIKNQLFGILHRFRLKLVAFRANNEVMFYRVRVSEQKRSYFCFLWWEEGELNSPNLNHEMCLYLDRAVCYFSCSKYTLGRKAVDNTDCYGEDAADSIMEKF